MKQMREEVAGLVRCKKCNELKAREMFRPDRVQYTCKPCLSIERTMVNRTPRGFAYKLHATQRRNAHNRNMHAPTYTQEELLGWIQRQPHTDTLFKQWEESGYDKQLAPSADRIDDSKSYTLDNIRLVTYRDNRGNIPVKR